MAILVYKTSLMKFLSKYKHEIIGIIILLLLLCSCSTIPEIIQSGEYRVTHSKAHIVSLEGIEAKYLIPTYKGQKWVYIAITEDSSKINMFKLK